MAKKKKEYVLAENLRGYEMPVGSVLRDGEEKIYYRDITKRHIFS